METIDILVVGSLNTDLVTQVDRFPQPGETRQGKAFHVFNGGKGANQAYAAAKLGGKVAMLGQVGRDTFGRDQISNLKEGGVQTEGISLDQAQPTGTAVIEVDALGENRIIIVPGANGSFHPDQIVACKKQFQQAKLVLLQLEIPKETVSAALHMAKVCGGSIMLDPAPVSRIPEAWFSKIDFLTPNLVELSGLSQESLDETSPLDHIEDCARSLCHLGTRCVIVKMGARGAVWVTAEESEFCPAEQVVAVDSTAAGDCFNGALAVQLCSGVSERDALKFAVSAATHSVTCRGAQPSMPSMEDLSGTP